MTEVANSITENGELTPEFIDKFNSLKRFQNKYGHTCVPLTGEHKELGEWVWDIVKNRRDLDPKIVSKLSSINFVFKVENYEEIVADWENFDARHLEGFEENPKYYMWYASLRKMREFYAENGHSSPSYWESRSLCSWGTAQREKKRAEALSQVQIDELEKLEFFWNPNQDKHTLEDRRRFQQMWDKMYALLADYREEYGNALVPQISEGKYKKLGRWVNTQRLRYTKGTLLPDRKKKLDQLGFVWNKLEADFKNRLKLIEKVKKEMGGDLNKARVCRGAPKDERRVANYLYRIRKVANKEDKKMKLLEKKLDLDWTPRNASRGRRKKEVVEGVDPKKVKATKKKDTKTKDKAKKTPKSAKKD